MLPSETMIWQPEFTDKTLSRKPGAVQTASFDSPSAVWPDKRWPCLPRWKWREDEPTSMKNLTQAVEVQLLLRLLQ
ncbi:hypothetical protein APT25_26125 [Escherichia coli]|nr:hypothetical protein APT25_26125 [Escherichia coli]